MAKTRIIGVRVDEATSAAFEQAAAASGVTVSEWLRNLGSWAVGKLKREGHKAGK